MPSPTSPPTSPSIYTPTTPPNHPSTPIPQTTSTLTSLLFPFLKRIMREWCTMVVGAMFMFQSEFLDPLSSFFVGYNSESNDANDSKKEELSQLFYI